MYLCHRFIRKIKDHVAMKYRPNKYVGDRRGRRIEAIALANKIWEIEQDRLRSLRKDEQWYLTEDHYITMTRSKDCMVWYIWRTYDDQARSFCKVIPAFCHDRDCIEKLLYHQPWACI